MGIAPPAGLTPAALQPRNRSIPMTTLQDIVSAMERIAPPWMARADDPVGLHCGNLQAPVARMLLALDATPEVVEEAQRLAVQAIVVHHPRIYTPLRTLVPDTAATAALTAAVRADIAIYSAHTNLDTAPGGINDLLATAAGLPETGRQILSTEGCEALFKLVVYVPETSLENLSAVLWEGGAGHIGNYSHCHFSHPGTGTFMGREGSNPTVGQPGRLERTEEMRAEYIIPESKVAACTEALRRTHPYEEPAFDLIPLRQSLPFGLGRFGTLGTPTILAELVRRLQAATRSPQIQIFGSPDRLVRRLGVWSGGGFPPAQAGHHRLDAIVIGELGYHALEQLALDNVAAIVLGHGPSEEIVLPALQNRLLAALPGVDVRIASTRAPSLCNF